MCPGAFRRRTWAPQASAYRQDSSESDSNTTVPSALAGVSAATLPSTSSNTDRPPEPSTTPPDPPPSAPRKNTCYVPRQPRPATPNSAPALDEPTAPPGEAQIFQGEARLESVRQGPNTTHATPIPTSLPAHPTSRLPRPHSSAPYALPASSDPRDPNGSRQLRLSDSCRTSDASRLTAYPTPPPSAPRGPRAEARPDGPMVVYHKPALPQLDTPTRPPVPHVQEHGIQRDLSVKQEALFVEKEIIVISDDDSDDDMPVDKATPQLGITESNLDQGTDGAATTVRTSDARSLSRTSTATLTNGTSEPVPDGRPSSKSAEPANMAYEQFEHCFGVPVPAAYDSMTEDAKEAWTSMQLQIASACDDSGKPTRLVRCAKVPPKGARKLWIFSTPLPSEDGVPKQLPCEQNESLSTAAKRPRSLSNSSLSSLSSLDYLDLLDQDDDRGVERTSDRPTAKKAPPESGKRTPKNKSNSPVPWFRVPRTLSGTVNTRRVSLDDLHNVSYCPVPPSILAHPHPSNSPLYRRWARSVRDRAERRDKSGNVTRVVKVAGIFNGKMTIRWAPMDPDDDLADMFIADTETSRKRKCAATTSLERESASRLAERPSVPADVQSDDDSDVPLAVKAARGGKRANPTSAGCTETESSIVKDTTHRQTAVSDDDTPDKSPSTKALPTSSVDSDAAPSVVAGPSDDPPADSNRRSVLKAALQNAFNDIDRWTEMLTRHPESRLIIGKQLKRTQEEVFCLDAELTKAIA